MKIFLSFLQSEYKYPIPSYDFWQHYIKNGIEEAGHEWVECPDADWALGIVPKNTESHLKWKEETWRKTIEWLKKHPVDFFLGYLYPEQVDELAINVIKNMGIPCVNFFCDHVRDFKKIPSEYSVFDLNWVPEYKAIKLYKCAGYPFVNLPMPMWVDPKYRVLKEEVKHQVTFIGSIDIQRILLLENVVQLEPDLPLAVYGAGWKADNTHEDHPLSSDYTLGKKIKFNLEFIKDQGLVTFLRKIKHRNLTYAVSEGLSGKTHHSPTFEQYNTLIAESMVTLGINRYESFRFPHTKPDSYSKLRDIEAPMLGACYLTEWTEGIEELYDTGNEIFVYRSPDELIAKVKELEFNKSLKKKLKVNGQKRALQDHSIPNSLNKLIQALGI